MLIRMFALKVINNERKILTRHEIIDRNAKQIGVGQVSHLLIYLSSLAFALWMHGP